MNNLKKIIVALLIVLSGSSFKAAAQDQDIQQLLLDIEKLTQFKAILSDMQQGYTMLTQGYGQVKSLAQGNFSLHSVFLDGLLKVNPQVAKYARVADIIGDEVRIVTEYKNAFARFKASNVFGLEEITYLGRVYAQLTSAALGDADELANVITASELRMTDDERLSAIDRIYASCNDKLNFLRDFNRRTSVLQAQREKEQTEVNNLKSLYP